MLPENETPESNEPSTESSNSAPDPIVNLKAEMNRKLGNLTDTNSRLEAQLAAIAASLKPAAPATPEKKVSVFEDEEAFAQSLEARVASRLDQVLSQRDQHSATIAALVNDYPELADGSSELTVRAVEIFNSMSPADKASSIAYKTAVQSAALEHGVRPKSKRAKSTENDSFSLGASSGGSEPRRAAKGQLDERTKLFAEAVGLNLDDPKNKASADRIKSNHGRKNYNKWA